MGAICLGMLYLRASVSGADFDDFIGFEEVSI